MSKVFTRHDAILVVVGKPTHANLGVKDKKCLRSSLILPPGVLLVEPLRTPVGSHDGEHGLKATPYGPRILMQLSIELLRLIGGFSIKITWNNMEPVAM